MKHYFLNMDSSHNGSHAYKVHVEECFFLPLPPKQIYLGKFPNEIAAVEAAKKLGFLNADGCKHCSPNAYHKIQ